MGSISGEVMFGGEKPSKQFLRRYTGYVEQFDSLLDILTVEEMLMYTAELKRPINQTHAEKKSTVEDLLEVLALQPCRNVRIGSHMVRGISGGQAKRVNIGIALVANPRILFLDEPTSGLDSFTANEVMEVVKTLAKHGITVCATIHSPTPYTFSLFDRLLLLLRGQVVYFGEAGSQALDYFHSSCPEVSAIKDGENEAEWIVDLTTQADRQDKASIFAEIFASSELKAKMDREIYALMMEGKSEISGNSRDELLTRQETMTPTWWAIKTLLKYRTLKNYKNAEFLGPRIADKLVFSVIIFTLYWQVGNNLSSDNLINIMAALYMWCILPAFGAVSYVPAIFLERPVHWRERNDGLYYVVAYFLYKLIEELTIAFANSIIFSNIVFWPMKLQGSWPLFWLVYLCSLSIGIVMAYFVTALSPTLDIANVALPAYVITLLFFVGLLMRWSDIPKWWQWYGYIDFLRYAWGALMINQFGGASNVNIVVSPQTIPILEFYSLSGVSMWAWLGIQACFFVVFAILAYLAISYVRYIKR